MTTIEQIPDGLGIPFPVSVALAVQ